jgi:hypothetical protein
MQDYALLITRDPFLSSAPLLLLTLEEYYKSRGSLKGLLFFLIRFRLREGREDQGSKSIFMRGLSERALSKGA